MALRTKKDIKKSSYYVWFLGAKESKGLRGDQFITPVIDHLILREKEIEPHKVTLQVSHKGLKIVQNVISTSKNAKVKNDTIKHFIPHNTITYVYQNQDVISCILLLFNPVTKCPLHVHVYRCDSVETATILRKQLEVLIQRPENQKKYEDLENRVKLRCVPESNKKKFNSSIGSETGTSTRESSSSSEDQYPSTTQPQALPLPQSTKENRIAALYDSLAAELRQKLNTKETPILLPPRDYDTVHRQKGNLQNIDLRRCLNTSIVGQNAKTTTGRRLESSGGSSGIGSDHAPSPDSPENGDGFLLDNQSTSDEEWSIHNADPSNYLINSSEMILPRPSRNNPEPEYHPKSPTGYHQNHAEPRFPRYPTEKHNEDRREKYWPPPQRYEDETFDEDFEYNDRMREGSKFRPRNAKYYPQEEVEDEEDLVRSFKTLERSKRYYVEENLPPRHKHYYQEEGLSSRSNPRSKYAPEYFEDNQEFIIRRRQRSSPTPAEVHASPRDRFKDAKEKFLLLERKRLEEQEVPFKDKTFLKRHESMAYASIEDLNYRYHNKKNRRTTANNRKEVPDRYRNPEKRRSMYAQLEEDHKNKSNEIAKELKRRSYLEEEYFEEVHGQKMKKPPTSGSSGGGYRHSYAEPKKPSPEKMPPKKYYPEMVHRTNSTVSNSGRVGIASVNPY